MDAAATSATTTAASDAAATSATTTAASDAAATSAPVEFGTVKHINLMVVQEKEHCADIASNTALLERLKAVRKVQQQLLEEYNLLEATYADTRMHSFQHYAPAFPDHIRELKPIKDEANKQAQEIQVFIDEVCDSIRYYMEKSHRKRGLISFLEHRLQFPPAKRTKFQN